MGDYPSGDFPDFVSPKHELRLSFIANAGDRVELGKQTRTATADGDRWDTTLELSQLMFAAPAESLIQDERLKVADIKVTSSADRSESYYLECALGPCAVRLFANGAKAPVVGPGEAPGSKPVGLLWSRNDKLYGSPKTVADVHLVASVDTPKERTRGCGRYRAGDGETKTISNAAIDKIVAVFDRRTGKQVARKQFRASMPACPRTIESSYSGVRAEVDSSPSG